MADFVFTSPGVKFRERNLTYVTRNVGITTLGLVGETQKGPAFQPVFVEDFGKFRQFFGGLNYDKYSNGVLKYQLPYVANSYLSESNQLWVTRVLGLSGYDAGKAWALTLSGGTSEYDGMVVAVIRSKAYVEDDDDIAPVTHFKTSAISITENNTISGGGDIYAKIKIQITPTNDPNTVEDESTQLKTIEFSLNPDSKDFLPNVIGNKAKGKNEYIYVESIYTDLIRKVDADNLAVGINTTILDINNSTFANYKTSFKTPETPWVVSEIKGSEIERLFKFVSISDGTAANKEIKISIQNINPVNGEFDVIIRDFNDRDDSIVVLESYSRCSMQKELNNYVGSRIGTFDGEYTLKSNYVTLIINENASNDSFPCGFEGYELPDYSSVNTETLTDIEGKSPKIFFNKTYLETDNLSRTYLGISERAYTNAGVNQNVFNYTGDVLKVKSKGFHLDSGATITYPVVGAFEVGAGAIRTYNDIKSSESTYYDSRSRKFTLVPYGGFDGWDEHRDIRTNGDLYRKGGILDGVGDGETPKNDYQAWEKGVDTFTNPEEVTINIFATPGLNWVDNTILIKDTLNKIEKLRTDSLYIIDSPDIVVNYELGNDRLDVRVAKDIVGLLDTVDIDSSYAATYFPYIQMKDSDNNVNVWLPPTCEVVKSMAFTDNSKFPWFAPAGLERGTTSALKTKYKLSLEARDILYAGRINPLAEFNTTGSVITAIFGQKTLQITENALDRINVRRLLLELKVLISNVSTRLLFEQNDETTVDQFLTKVKPILQRVQRERGLYDFRVVMDDTINTAESRDRNELYGEIYLKPTRSLEFIGIGFTLTPSGSSFDEVI